MDDSWVAILTNLATSMVGIVAITAGVVGFWGVKLAPAIRLFAIVIGFLALPLGFLPTGDIVQMTAAGTAILFSRLHKLSARKLNEAP